VAQRAPAPPDMVIADVVMPGMAGKPLADEVERRWPGTPVLFTSGYTGADAVSRGLLREGRDFLQKPIEPDALAQHVRRILDARRAEIGR
jgi:two-component system cell cycle sensor histidine kinase/response regulator CckA